MKLRPPVPVDLSSGGGSFPTLDHVWIAAVFMVICVRALAWPIIPSDFWWQIAYGRSIVENGAIPIVDTFSYTRAGEPYFDQPWLSQIFMYGVFRLGGPALSLISLAAALCISYALLLRLCLGGNRDVRLAAGIMLLSLPVAMTNWSVRSQVFALPIFVAYLAVLRGWHSGARGRAVDGPAELEEGQERRHFLWLLPVLMVVWVNLHGSFVLGGVLIALFFLGEAGRLVGRGRLADAEWGHLRSLLIWGGLTAVAMLVNPRGVGVFEYVLGLVGNPAVQGLVQEWMPPTTGSVVGRLFFLFAMFAATVAAVGRHRPELTDVLMIGAFFWLALSGERHVMWFAVVSVPFIVDRLRSGADDARGSRSRQGSRAMNAAFLGTLVLAVVVVLPWIKTNFPLPPHLRSLVSPDTPVASVEAIRADPMAPERLFHTEGSGSYLMWAAPEQRVFLDARVELYPFEQIRAYQLLSAGIAVDSLLEVYAIDGLLVDLQRQERLHVWAEASPEWILRFEEACCSYWVRAPRRCPTVARGSSCD